MWTDAHCHLALPPLMEDLDAVVARSRAAGVSCWVQGGVDPEDWARQRTLAARFGDSVVTAFGLHPWWVAKASDDDVEQGLAALAKTLSGADIAGEMGLDRSIRGHDPLAYGRQRQTFRRQLRLARDARKPVVLHVVRAHAEAARLIAEGGPLTGIVHSFNGDVAAVRTYVDLGLHISVSARSITGKHRAALAAIPRERLLVETDAPDGAREPGDLHGVATALGAALGATAVDLLNASTAAVRRLLGKDS